MAGLQRFGLFNNGATFKNVADLAGAQIVFRHIRVKHKRAEFPFYGNRPTGFLERFAVKRGRGVFARIDAATRQLEFGERLALVRNQQIAPAPDDAIRAGAVGVGNALNRGRAKSSHVYR